jgi:ribosomal RNA-processing protein 7
LGSTEAVFLEEGGEGMGLLRRWVQEQRALSVDPSELQLSVDAYMSHFDERTEEEKRRQATRQVDEDGFELVTYKRKARDLGPEKSAEPEKKKKKELTDFYKFQVRDKRREELASLRRRFDADKNRVAEMKIQRKFKPF